MQPDRKPSRGWLVVIGAYWVLQALYLLSPIDLVPDVIPIIGFGDDLLGILSAIGVTAFSMWRMARAEGAPVPSLPETFGAPMPAMGTDVSYVPLTADELDAL